MSVKTPKRGRWVRVKRERYRNAIDRRSRYVEISEYGPLNGADQYPFTRHDVRYYLWRPAKRPKGVEPRRRRA